MPDRAAPKIRIERGEGRERVFWEISRTGDTLTTRFGKHLNPGRTLTKKYATADDASHALDKAVAEKRGEGYSEPAPRAEVGSTGKKGVSAHDAKLEALIEAAPSDANAYLVYADWLQQQGDVRGELIAVQHRLATATDEREITKLERDEATLFKKYEAELLGPLAAHTVQRTNKRSFRTFSWRHGFIRTARLTRRWRRQVLIDLFTHPSGRFVERLVGPWSLDPHEEGTADILRTLAPPTLRSLFMGDGSAWDPIHIPTLWTTLPRLRSLTLDNAVTALGDPTGNVIEELTLGKTNHATVAAIADYAWPMLTRLHVTFLSDAFEAFERLLERAMTPRVAHVSVRHWLVGERGPITQDDRALEVVRMGAVRKLARLDVELPLSASGAKALLASPQTLRLIETIGLVPVMLDESLKKALAAAHPPIEWLDVPEEKYLELDAIDAR
jgi:uncharacterized protein (TIGR02996 family)